MSTLLLNETRHDGGFLVSQANGHYSKDIATLGGGARVIAGTVLGQQASIASAAGTNTGNGSLANLKPGASTLLAGAYPLTALSASLFSVTAPSGARLPDATVDAAYSDALIQFKITSLKSTAAATAGGSNTGNGTFGTITAAYPALVGGYALTMTAATAFTVVDPNGNTVGTGSTGVAFSAGGIGFTLTAGGTAFVAGDNFTIATSSAALAGTATASAIATNTGNGTFGTITAASPAVVGAYKLVMESATTFVIFSPTGIEVGHGVTGSAQSFGGLGFTLTAGGTAFVAGDSFTLTTTSTGTPFAAGDSFTLTLTAGNYVTSVSTATDGSETPAAVLYGTTDASAGPVPCTIVRRSCEVNASELIWDTSYSGPQITAGLAILAGRGVVSR